MSRRLGENELRLFKGHEVRIPLISDDCVVVEMPGYAGVYLVSQDPDNPGFTWVHNALGTDGATYEIGADQITITSHSTHNDYSDGKVYVFKNPSENFWDWQTFYQKLLDKMSEMIGG